MDWIFWSCACQCGLYQGCWQGGFSSHRVFTRALARLVSDHWCLVLQGVSQHLGYFISLDSHPYPIWTLAWWIRSNLEGPLENFLCLRCFWRRLRSGQKIFSIASAQAGACFSPSDILGSLRSYRRVWYTLGISGSGVVIGSSTVRPLVWQRFFWALDRPKVLPDYHGFPKLSEGLLWNCEQRPRKFFPDFCCSRIETKKFSSVGLTSLWQDFKCSRLSSCSGRRRGKNSGNRRIC